jgi:hypothetical protein
MRPFAALLVVALTACAPDPMEPQRDYTLTVCPGRVDPTDTAVCDRGVGYTPRFVTLGQCFADLSASEGSLRESAHPSYTRCRAESLILLVRWDDVRIVLGR